MLRNIHTFEGDCTGLRAWIFTIAQRRLIDEQRRFSRRPATEPITAAVPLPNGDDVETTVMQSVSAQRVAALCDTLAPDQGAVVRLRLLGHHTIDDVARMLGKTPGAVKALQHRGVRALARVLTRGEEGRDRRVDPIRPVTRGDSPAEEEISCAPPA